MSSLQIPSLSRSIAHYLDAYFMPQSPQSPPPQMNAVDFFDSYARISDNTQTQRSTINPLASNPIFDSSANERYVVDEAPLDETPGTLQLKLPILCSDETTMYSTPPIGTTNREENKNFSALLTTTLTSVYDLALSHVTFAVDSISVEQMIRRIRNVRLNTPEIHEIFQTDNSSSGSLYAEHLICICFDSYGNHRFAKFIVNVKEVSMECGPLDKWSTFDAVALEVVHLQGDSRISMEYFKRARFCVSIGDDILDSDYAVDMPDFREGFSDMYEDNMVSNPNSFE
jgi:hypothetical protein